MLNYLYQPMHICLISSHEILLHIEEVVVVDLFLSHYDIDSSIHFHLHEVIELTIIPSDVCMSSKNLLSLHFPLHLCELCQVFKESCVKELIIDVVVDPAL